MALLYPWATKEYLLWNMTIGQIIFYHNKGIEIREGKSTSSGGLLDKSASELRKIRDEVQSQFDLDKSNELKKQFASKYGDVG